MPAKARVNIVIKRAYDPPEPADGYRVLVDRLWPRGVSKERAKLSGWWKELTPSDALRKWFGHEPEKFAEFAKRYLAELRAVEAEARAHLREAQGRTLTLVYGARNAECNHALVLAEYLRKLG